MTTSHLPVPTSLRCLAVLPAIIMLGGYALLGPKPAESNVVVDATLATISKGTQVAVVKDSPQIGEKVVVLGSTHLAASH